MSEEHHDVGDKNAGDDDDSNFVIGLAPTQNPRCGESHEDDVKGEIRRSRQPLIKHEITADAESQHDDAKTKEMAALPEVVGTQVNLLVVAEVWIDQPGDQIKRDRLCEHDDEVAKVPVMPMPEAKHCPPVLTAGEE